VEIIPKEELIRRTSGPKVLPFVAKKVLSLVGDEETSISELCRTIEKDQAISANVLKIANSAYYGLRQEVTSIRHAIVVLGLKAIRDLVITVSTKLQYKRFGITEQMMWEHSIGAAIAARYIAGTLSKELEEVAFLGGLMHDFGKVVMNNEQPDAYLAVMQEIYNEGRESTEAEKSVFGYAHTGIGAAVVESWGFPAVFREMLRSHHSETAFTALIEDPFIARAVACIHLANNVCKVLGIGYRSPDEGIDPASLSSVSFLNIPAERIGEHIQNIDETYQQEKAVFV
jgi:putative nucleotidyltransferase with HDIG domain